jgi:hypothetical protein
MVLPTRASIVQNLVMGRFPRMYAPKWWHLAARLRRQHRPGGALNAEIDALMGTEPFDLEDLWLNAADLELARSSEQPGDEDDPTPYYERLRI